MALFMNRQAGKNLEENEIKAVYKFLRSYVAPFYESRLRKSVLEQLVYNAEVLNIESDDRIFTHKTDENALFENVEQPVAKRQQTVSGKVQAAAG